MSRGGVNLRRELGRLPAKELLELLLAEGRREEVIDSVHPVESTQRSRAVTLRRRFAALGASVNVRCERRADGQYAVVVTPLEVSGDE